MQHYARFSTLVFCLSCCCYSCVFVASASPERRGGGGGETCLTSPTTSADMINETCTECAELSRAFSYSFCSASLGPIPVAHVSNIQGLAIISIELAVQNATDTVSTIKALLEDKSLDLYTVSCLRDCLELYGDAIPTLLDSIEAFMAGQYGVAGVWVSGVMEDATTCEDGFRAREGEASPLTTENRSLFQLCGIALCIANLITVDALFEDHQDPVEEFAKDVVAEMPLERMVKWMEIGKLIYSFPPTDSSSKSKEVPWWRSKFFNDLLINGVFQAVSELALMLRKRGLSRNDIQRMVLTATSPRLGTGNNLPCILAERPEKQPPHELKSTPLGERLEEMEMRRTSRESSFAGFGWLLRPAKGPVVPHDLK